MSLAAGRIACRARRRVSGAAAIEFAFLFPLLLFIIYSTVVYGYVFFLRQTLNLVVQESAKAAVAVATSDPATGVVLPRSQVIGNYQAAVSAYFNNAKSPKYFGLLSSLPAAVVGDFEVPQVMGPTDIVSGGTIFGQSITVRGRVLNVRAIFPQLTLPGIGASLPPLPATLYASATVRVS